MSYEAILVRVWNDNIYPYKEEFKGNMIEIAPKKFIEMEENEAVEFKGVYVPIVRDGDGQPVPTSFKKLRIERTTKSAHKPVQETEHRCQACGYLADSKQELDLHVDENHLDSLLDKNEADKRRKK